MAVEHKNEVELIGYISKEIKTLNGTGKNGKDWNMTKFGLCTEKEFKGRVNKTYHNMLAWNELAIKIDDESQMGYTVRVKGEITTNVWEKDDGTKVYTPQIVISDFEVLEKSNSSAERPSNDIPPADDDNDDLPF